MYVDMFIIYKHPPQSFANRFARWPETLHVLRNGPLGHSFRWRCFWMVPQGHCSRRACAQIVPPGPTFKHGCFFLGHRGPNLNTSVHFWNLAAQILNFWKTNMQFCVGFWYFWYIDRPKFRAFVFKTSESGRPGSRNKHSCLNKMFVKSLSEHNGL